MSLDTSQALLEKIAAAMAPVGGVRAIVLGGSRGRGVQHAASDYDIGLYYAGDLDIVALEAAARTLNDGATAAPLVTQPGRWGAWVNGGGWLTVDGTPVDILYRDMGRVAAVIAQVRAGQFECAYHIGHPHGFVSAMYAGEVATCRVLYEPDGFVTMGKRELDPYPDALRGALIARFSDEARFFLAIAAKGAKQGDVNYVAGCLFRVASCLLQVIFAINRQWLLNEKGALALASGFEKTPADLRPRLERAYSNLIADSATLGASLEQLTALLAECAALA